MNECCAGQCDVGGEAEERTGKRREIRGGGVLGGGVWGGVQYFVWIRF